MSVITMTAMEARYVAAETAAIPVFVPGLRMPEQIKTASGFLADCSDSRRIFCWESA